MVEERVVERRRSCTSSSVEDHWCCLWRTLVTLCEEPKCVNLAHKVCDARPPTKSKPNHKHPHHHKHIDRVRPYPPSKKSRWPLHCILQITVVHHNPISQNIRNQYYFLGPVLQFVCNCMQYIIYQVDIIE